MRACRQTTFQNRAHHGGSQPSVLQPTEIRTEAVVPSPVPDVRPNGLSQALVDGKLDAGLISATSYTPPVDTPVPRIVVVKGPVLLGDLLDLEPHAP
ncbi:MAG: hypothetical protein ACC658_12800 [Acidimicrobiia bacterium]